MLPGQILPGQMVPGQMLPGPMLPGQILLLKSVLDVPRNLPLRFCQNRVNSSRDIADIELVWVGGSGWWWWCKVIFT